MQAITTKVLQVTETKGLRIKATTASGIAIVLSWEYAFDELDNARAAVDQLIREKLNEGWRGTYHAAATADGYVFVRDDNPTLSV